MRHLESHIRCVLAFLLLLSLSFYLTQPAARASGLEGLEESEREMLSELFDLMLMVEGASERMDELDGEIAGLEADIVRLQDTILEGKDRYLEARSRTVTSLRWINRLGPASYLEVLFGASSLRDLLRKTELITAAARGAVTALADIQREKQSLDELETEIEILTEQLEILLAEREPLAMAEAELEQQKTRLAGAFGNRWDPIYDELSSLRSLWESDVVPYLEELRRRLSRLADEGVPPEDITIIPSLFSFKAIIPASSLNLLMEGEPSLRGAAFRFAPGEAHLEIAELQIGIRGTLSIDDRGLVVYHVSGLELAGLAIRYSTALGLLDDLSLDLGPSLQGMTPRSLTVGEGVLELVIVLFQ